MPVRQLTEAELVHWELALRDEVRSWMEDLGVRVGSVMTEQTSGGSIVAIARWSLTQPRPTGTSSTATARRRRTAPIVRLRTRMPPSRTRP